MYWRVISLARTLSLSLFESSLPLELSSQSSNAWRVFSDVGERTLGCSAKRCGDPLETISRPVKEKLSTRNWNMKRVGGSEKKGKNRANLPCACLSLSIGALQRPETHTHTYTMDTRTTITPISLFFRCSLMHTHTYIQ